jgi:hypothetical protein
MSRSYRTKSSQHVTLTLLSGGKGESESVSSPFGPVRAGLTTLLDHSTTRASQDQQLSALLSTLEKQAEILLLKSYEVLDTFLTDTTHLVEPTHFKNATTTTEEIKC